MSALSPALPPAAGARRLLLLVLAVAVLGLFVSSFVYRLNHPWTLHQSSQAAGQASQTSDSNAALTALMQGLQANPNDPTILLDLAGHFSHTQDWARTEHFARRLIVLEPSNFDALYLLGMAEHGLGRHQESASKLEEALRIKNDPALSYSLAVLYAYYLENKTAAIAHLQQALKTPDLAPALKADMEQELKKLTL